MGTPLSSASLLLSLCPPWGWGDLEVFGSFFKVIWGLHDGLPVSEPHVFRTEWGRVEKQCDPIQEALCDPEGQ